MRALSPTMERALVEIREHPGTPARELPGGMNTVAALMRRHLAEVAAEGRDASRWPVYVPEHQHTWTTTMHMDGCHWWSTGAKCECGAQLGVRGERSVRADPYSAIWMDNPDGCERCRRLLAGGHCAHEVTIVRGAA